MSAFIVDDLHIHALLTAGLSDQHYGPLSWFAPEEAPGPEDHEAGQPWGPTAIESANRRRRELTRETADVVGLMLVAQNYASVNYRYDEKDEEPLYRFQSVAGYPDPVIVLKALDCYEYQACETPNWEETEAHAFCQSLRSRMIHHLPGYEDAPWDIQSPAVFSVSKPRKARV